MDREFMDFLQAMETRLHGKIESVETRVIGLQESVEKRFRALETRLREEIESLETRLRAHTESVETKLLGEFWKWARTADARYRQSQNVVGGLEERMGVVEDRLAELERRR